MGNEVGFDNDSPGRLPNRRTFLSGSTASAFATLALIPGHGGATSRAARGNFISVKHQREDVNALLEALQYGHIGLYRYQTEQRFRARAEELRQTTKADCDLLDFLAKIAAFNAQIHTAHLLTLPGPRLRDRVLALPRCPVVLDFVGTRAFAGRNASSTHIPIGAEITAINDVKMSEIIRRIWPYIPSDGFIETRKPHLLNVHNFPDFEGFDFYYSLYVGRPARFQLDLLEGGNRTQVHLAGLDEAARTMRIKQTNGVDLSSHPPQPSYQLLPDNGAAIFTIPRAYEMPGDTTKFPAILGALLKAVHQHNINNLVIDVRGNTGGVDELGTILFGHLSTQPFRFYRSLQYKQIQFAPLAKYIEPDQRGRVDEKYPGRYDRDDEGTYWRKEGTYFGLKETPAGHYTSRPFLGNVYLLVDGGSYSAGAQVAAFLLDRKRAVLIGEEAGGDFSGPDGGSSLPIRLPNSEIGVRIPGIRSNQSVQPWPLGRGAIPHIHSVSTISDKIAGRDRPLLVALDLIRRGITVESFLQGPGLRGAVRANAPSVKESE